MDGSENCVELVLSRHLFDGMKIRVTAVPRKGAGKDAVSELHIHLLTHSEAVARFFLEQKEAFVGELQKRGLAVHADRVMVERVA